ncbi:MAG: hypothetical protein AABX05_01775 [Nanoarchaeota archaeon]
MKQTIRKLVKTGYGLGLLSVNEAKKAASVAKRELQLNDEESIKLAKELMHNSEKLSKEILSTASSYFESALVKSGVASKKEVKVAKRLLKGKAGRLKKLVKHNVSQRLHKKRR